MNERVWLYGLKLAGLFLYVGQTKDLYQRERLHWSFNPALRQTDLIVLRQVQGRPNARRIEKQVVSALKRRGECWLNGTMYFAQRTKKLRRCVYA